MSYIYITLTFVTRFWVVKTKPFQNLRKNKTENYATLLLEIGETVLAHVKILIRLYLIFQTIT